MSQTPHPEHRYVIALLENDSRLIREIYNRYAARIEQFVCANSGTPEDARDVFQEALLAITRQARDQGMVLTCPFEAYLYLVCRGKWLNELKRRKRAGVTIRETERFKDVAEADALADATLYEDERNRLFWHFFNMLPESCRTLIKLSWSELSMQEVAEHLGYTYAYARKRKSECLAQLTAWIQASPAYKALKR
ncbi:MAG: RNA polymerase sigma factor [Saprospiraceae bacterium]|nr:RNA polymerase sigma factor [Saprospiraceae bacterium]MDW8483982.1 sigma-70 family RNA polymerase sigma factor [Saprospiraceae bacterium]